jgi:hypothetical protein
MRSVNQHHTIVSYKFQALREDRQELVINLAGNGEAIEGAVCRDDTRKSARLALLYEFLARSSFGFDDFGQGGDFRPLLVRAKE